MKYKLTKEQINNLHKYLELLNSNDKESIKLGIALFYNEFCDFKCPCRPTRTFRISDMDFDYEYLTYEYSNIDCWYWKSNLLYWTSRIKNLLFTEYYIDELSKTYIN